MRAERHVLLPTPPEDAWSVLIDWERQASWMRDADRVRVLTPDRRGVGVRVAVRTRVLRWLTFTDVLEVTGWDPPRRLEVAHRRFLRGSGEWILEPDDNGVRFTWIEAVSMPPALLGELALLAYRPLLLYAMGRAMTDLRRFVISTGPDRSGDGG